MKFKKVLASILIGSMAIALVGCGGGKSTDTPNDDKGSDVAVEDKIKVTLLGGGFGDKSYWDSAKGGTDKLTELYGDKVEVTVVDMSIDPKKWVPAMYDVAESDADIIISGGFQQKENMQTVASEYPDKDWIMFDSALDYENNDIKNVYNMDYKSNESGYLAGMVAAHMTTSDNEGINKEKAIGFIGGMANNPAIDDFLIGYIEGAQAVDPEIKVAVSYLGTFDDSAKGKEATLAQFNSSNVDIVFAAAGAAGIGCIEAAENEGKYFVGVDSDQSLLYEGREEQDRIVTSALKNVGNSIVYAIEKYINDELPIGEYEVLGVKEGAAGIVYNDILESYVDEDFIKTLKEAESKITAGEIEVTSSDDLTSDEISKLVESVK